MSEAPKGKGRGSFQRLSYPESSEYDLGKLTMCTLADNGRDNTTSIPRYINKPGNLVCNGADVLDMMEDVGLSQHCIDIPLHLGCIDDERSFVSFQQ